MNAEKAEKTTKKKVTKSAKGSVKGSSEGTSAESTQTKVELDLEATMRSIGELRERVLVQDETIGNLVLNVTALQKEVNELKQSGGRVKGPKSTRDMTEEDAVRVISGDLKDMATKKAAETLGLSYGQIYSARGGYTFKHLTGAKI